MTNRALLFDKALEYHHISKKEFSKESKIPYDTVAGWKKRGQVPEYAIVLLKKIAADKHRRYHKATIIKRRSLNDHDITPKIAQRIQAAFWGQDYDYRRIIKEVKRGVPAFVRPFFVNLYYKDILNVLDQKEIRKILLVIRAELDDDTYVFWQKVVSR